MRRRRRRRGRSTDARRTRSSPMPVGCGAQGGPYIERKSRACEDARVAGADPIIFVVESDEARLANVRESLVKRYSDDYRVLVELRPRDALAAIEGLCGGGDEIAIVLAGQWLDGMDGI